MSGLCTEKERPDLIISATEKLKIQTANDEISLFVTVGFIDKKPFEMFLSTKNAYLCEHLNLVAVLTSKLLRSGCPLDEVIDEFGKIYSPFTSHFMPGRYANSLYDRVGKVLLSLSKNPPDDHIFHLSVDE